MSRSSTTPPSVISLLVRSLVFVLVTVAATTVLGATIRNAGSTGSGATYTAVFTDATSLNKGDDVRMAGVRIGQVDSIEITDQRLARVRFSIDDEIALRRGTTAALRFRNLVGQRFLSLAQGEVGAEPIAKGTVLGVDQTEPALDLTMLFNGFQPLFQLLSPQDVNELSYQIIQVFQGEGSTVQDLLSSTASLTSTLADKDKVIGSVIDNLNDVLQVVNSRSEDLDTMITTLQGLVTGLAEDRQVIGQSFDGMSKLTRSVAGLLDQGRAPLRTSITELGRLSGNLADEGPVLDRFLERLPDKLDAIGRLGSYGSWLNVYLCQVGGAIPDPEGYLGGVGVDLTASRCGA
jgi:phospholipid/cholesterol/gamma-HCH transport system substrate-binding protein